MAICTIDILSFGFILHHLHQITMSKLKALFLSTLIAFATWLPSVTLQQDIIETVIPIPSEQLQGGGNNFGLIIKAYPGEPIDELSTYLIANYFTAVLADGDNLGEIGYTKMVFNPPYQLVVIEIIPQSTATITRRVALDCLYQSIAWLAQHQLVHAEFTLTDGERNIAKAAFTVNVPDASAVSGSEDTAGANQTLDVYYHPRIKPAYLPNARDLSLAEVFVSAMAAAKSQAWKDKNDRMGSFRESVGFLDAYVEVRGVNGPTPESELTVLGFLAAMWKIPFHMLDEGRLAESSGVISYNEVPKGEALILKGKPPAEEQTPDTS